MINGIYIFDEIFLNKIKNIICVKKLLQNKTRKKYKIKLINNKAEKANEICKNHKMTIKYI